MEILRGLQGYRLEDTVKGPQLEEATTQVFLNQKLIEESPVDGDPVVGIFRGPLSL